MWTWQFELNDILTTLTIIGIVCGAGYKVLVLPLLQRQDAQRVQDNLIIQERWRILNTTLDELKGELKLSREERVKAEAKQVLLTAKLEAVETRLDEYRDELHEHISHAH